MLGEDALDRRRPIDAALAEGTRGDEIAQLLEPRAGEPAMGRGVPPGLLDARARLLGKDPAHRLAQQDLGDAVADLHRARHAEHELDKAMIEEGIEMVEPETRRLAILGAKAAGRRLAVDVLIGAVTQEAAERVVEHRHEI